MKRSHLKDVLIFAAVLLAASLCAHSQTTPGNPAQSNYPISQQTQSGAPSGNCPGTNVYSLNTANGNLYTCPTPGSSWVLAATAGGAPSASPTFTGTVTFPDGTICNPGGCTINTSGTAGSLSPSASFVKTAAGIANATTISQQNLVLCSGWQSGPYGGTYNKMSYNVNTPDNTTDLYDIGIAVAATGARVCHTGAIVGTSSFAATGQVNVSTTGNCVITPNTRYFTTLTSSAVSPLAKMGAELAPTFQNTATACGSSASGVIPDPLTAVPADAWTQGGVPTITLHN